MTLKFNRVRAVVKEDVRDKFHRAKCSDSWVILRTEKKNSDEKQYRPSLLHGQYISTTV